MNKKRNRGFTLVELLMVSSTIIVVTATLGAFWVGASRIPKELRQAQYNQNAVRLLIHDISRDFRNAEIAQVVDSATPTLLSLDLVSITGEKGKMIYYENGGRCWRKEIDAAGLEVGANPVTPKGIIVSFHPNNEKLLRVDLIEKNIKSLAEFERNRSFLISRRADTISERQVEK